MVIALHDHENNNYPNLALMKISAWHKLKGDRVSTWMPLMEYDKVYSSKIFTWTPLNQYLPKDAIIGGTGYDIKKKLPKEIEFITPDYSLYNCDRSYGFLTRGCIRNCSWCFVPEKEGCLKPNQDIEEIALHKNVILMDNNILACDYGINQIRKIVSMGLKVDFNQGLDARLINNDVAELLSKVKWLSPLRLACDSQAIMPSIKKAVRYLRKHKTTPKNYFCYCLVQDVDEAYNRVMFLKDLGVDPFAQPYRDKEGTPPTKEQRRFARWVNHKAIFKTVKWSDYKKHA